jgi:CRISPR/Cas system-associated protein Csm6
MTKIRKITLKPMKPFVDHMVEDIRRFREAKAAEYGYNPTVAYQAMVELHDELMKVRGLAANSRRVGFSPPSAR